MEVKGKTAVAVEIDNKELVRALKYKVYTELRLPLHHKVFHKDGAWIERVLAHTTHSFEYDQIIRPGDQGDIEVFEAFHTLKEFLDNV
jgi:hypothetical protein